MKAQHKFSRYAPPVLERVIAGVRLLPSRVDGRGSPPIMIVLHDQDSTKDLRIQMTKAEALALGRDLTNIAGTLPD